MVLNSGNYILVTKSDKMFVNFSIICCLTDREDDILNFNLPAGKSFLNVTHMVNFQLCVSYCRVQPGSTEQNFHHGPERTGANRIHKRSPLFYSWARDNPSKTDNCFLERHSLKITSSLEIVLTFQFKLLHYQIPIITICHRRSLLSLLQLASSAWPHSCASRWRAGRQAYWTELS